MHIMIRIWRLLSAELLVLAFELCHPRDIRRNNLPNDSQLNKTHNTFECYQTYLAKTVIYNNQLMSIVSLIQFTLGSLHWQISATAWVLKHAVWVAVDYGNHHNTKSKIRALDLGFAAM